MVKALLKGGATNKRTQLVRVNWRQIPVINYRDAQYGSDYRN
jgi:hypothetical protein